MEDKEFINQIAKKWLELGGDSAGVSWTWTQLRDRIVEIEQDSED